MYELELSVFRRGAWHKSTISVHSSEPPSYGGGGEGEGMTIHIIATDPRPSAPTSTLTGGTERRATGPGCVVKG